MEEPIVNLLIGKIAFVQPVQMRIKMILILISELVGHLYIRSIICLQHQKGALTSEVVEACESIDFLCSLH